MKVSDGNNKIPHMQNGHLDHLNILPSRLECPRNIYDEATVALQQHEKSANHIKRFLQLNSFGQTRIDHQLDEQKRISDLLHNEKAKRNREVLKRLIDAVCYLAKQELPFRGHDESLTSVNKGNYIELLHLRSEYDPLLATHLKDSTIFRGTSSTIQNDLIANITLLVVKKIKEEIAQTNFVVIMLDETSDIINKSQLTTVLRYIDENSEIQERFLVLLTQEVKVIVHLLALARSELEKYQTKLALRTLVSIPHTIKEIRDNRLTAKVTRSIILDFSLRGFVKKQVYRIPVADLNDLKLRIRLVIQNFTIIMLRNTWREVENRLDACSAINEVLKYIEIVNV
ncbi:hypothetical protein ANN_08667 [Periplaneta americana]|uniref:DUF4371 domain-containing protein n=1 Tax=Periplaneta americana TaxID=6978 RepID=A0ABQ8T385_PERAM|nr:hypothetical protein ANN_08667 [Periplaneta americana]